MKLSITADTVLERYGTKLDKLAKNDARRVMMRALNRGGDQARTQVRRSLVRQTGIKYGLIHKALDTDRATPKNLVYKLVAVGNETNIALFGATQRKKGVSAAPWKKRRIFKGTFLVGSNVFKRKGKARLPIKAVYGPNIAREALRDPTKAAWRKVDSYVEKRLIHELGRLFASA